jgi:hypothetical protein
MTHLHTWQKNGVFTLEHLWHYMWQDWQTKDDLQRQARSDTLQQQ